MTSIGDTLGFELSDDEVDYAEARLHDVIRAFGLACRGGDAGDRTGHDGADPGEASGSGAGAGTTDAADGTTATATALKRLSSSPAELAALAARLLQAFNPAVDVRQLATGFGIGARLMSAAVLAMRSGGAASDSVAALTSAAAYMSHVVPMPPSAYPEFAVASVASGAFDVLVPACMTVLRSRLPAGSPSDPSPVKWLLSNGVAVVQPMLSALAAATFAVASPSADRKREWRASASALWGPAAAATVGGTIQAVADAAMALAGHAAGDSAHAYERTAPAEQAAAMQVACDCLTSYATLAHTLVTFGLWPLVSTPAAAKSAGPTSSAMLRMLTAPSALCRGKIDPDMPACDCRVMCGPSATALTSAFRRWDSRLAERFAVNGGIRGAVAALATCGAASLCKGITPPEPIVRRALAEGVHAMVSSIVEHGGHAALTSALASCGPAPLSRALGILVTWSSATGTPTTATATAARGALHAVTYAAGPRDMVQRAMGGNARALIDAAAATTADIASFVDAVSQALAGGRAHDVASAVASVCTSLHVAAGVGALGAVDASSRSQAVAAIVGAIPACLAQRTPLARVAVIDAARVLTLSDLTRGSDKATASAASTVRAIASSPHADDCAVLRRVAPHPAVTTSAGAGSDQAATPAPAVAPIAAAGGGADAAGAAAAAAAAMPLSTTPADTGVAGTTAPPLASPRATEESKSDGRAPPARSGVHIEVEDKADKAPELSRAAAAKQRKAAARAAKAKAKAGAEAEIVDGARGTKEAAPPEAAAPAPADSDMSTPASKTVDSDSTAAPEKRTAPVIPAVAVAERELTAEGLEGVSLDDAVLALVRANPTWSVKMVHSTLEAMPQYTGTGSKRVKRLVQRQRRVVQAEAAASFA